MDYLLKCNVALGCSLVWHQSNLGERQTWLLHRAEKTVCVCVREIVLGVENSHTTIQLAKQKVLPSLPPTRLYSQTHSGAGTTV